MEGFDAKELEEAETVIRFVTEQNDILTDKINAFAEKQRINAMNIYNSMSVMIMSHYLFNYETMNNSPFFPELAKMMEIIDKGVPILLQGYKKKKRHK